MDERGAGGLYGFFLCEPESKTLAEAFFDPSFRPTSCSSSPEFLRDRLDFVEDRIIDRKEIEEILEKADLSEKSRKG